LRRESLHLDRLESGKFEVISEVTSAQTTHRKREKELEVLAIEQQQLGAFFNSLREQGLGVVAMQ
jgi:hypothetical protein